MILSSFTFIFTSVFQSNIELWIHFFLCVLWTKSVASVKEMFFKRKDSLWRQKKTSPFWSFKSLLVTRKLHLLRNIVMMQDLLWTHQNLSFQNTVSFVGQDDKSIFSTHGKMKAGFFSFFFKTVGETFTRGIDSTGEHFTEGSLKKSRWLERTLQRSLFHYLQNFIQYNIRHRFSHTFS